MSKDLKCFLKKFDPGSIIASVIAAGKIVPDTANRNELVAERPISIPNGIASFSSRNGVIAAKNVTSSGGKYIEYVLFCARYTILVFTKINRRILYYLMVLR